MASLTSLLSDGMALAGLTPSERRRQLGGPQTLVRVSPAQRAFIDAMRRRFGSLDTDALRNEPTDSAVQSSWLRRAAARLDASGYRSLDDVPDNRFFTVAHL